MIFVITGHPGAGKTRLATHLSLELQNHRENCLLLHTDLLKVTLRTTNDLFPKGLSCGVDAVQRAQKMAPFLHTHIQKAHRDQYHLIIEGTLALGLQPSAPCCYFEVTTSQSICAERCTYKASKTQESILKGYDYDHFQQLLERHRPRSVHLLEGSKSTNTLVQEIMMVFHRTKIRYPT